MSGKIQVLDIKQFDKMLLQQLLCTARSKGSRLHTATLL